MENFSKQKIIFQEIVQEPSFMFDSAGTFFCLDTGRIIIGNDIKYLIAILNSKLFFFAVKSYYGGGGLGEAGVRMKHTFFENFNCPLFDTEMKRQIEKLLCEKNYERIDFYFISVSKKAPPRKWRGGSGGVIISQHNEMSNISIMQKNAPDLYRSKTHVALPLSFLPSRGAGA